MTDKNLKQEECTIAVKAGSRVHTSASLHTLSQPNATVIAPHGGYSMPPEVVHHAHLPYRMLQPSFQAYPLSLSGPMPTPKPGHISNDLGPPIFMPPLNLGIPKSSQTVGKLPQSTLPSSSVAPPTSLYSTHLDRTSSPSIITSFPGLVTQSGGGYNATPMLHPPHQPYPLNSNNSKPQMLTKNSSNQMNKSEVDGNKMAVTHGSGGMNHSSSSSLGFVSKNLIGQNAAGLGAGPLMKQQTAVTKATSGLMGDLSHYQQVPVNKSIVNKLPKESANETSREMGVVDALLGVSMAGGLGSGNVLVCTEGLPPPVPRNIGSMTSDMKTDRSNFVNHLSSDPYHIGSGNSLQDSQIPWPEAVSKNIIIPAPNLTGKDIANLTSAANSPIATNDRTGNDVSWLPLSDNHTHQTDNHTPPSSMDPLSCSSGMPHELQSGPSGMSLVSQNAIVSPRPSILRKRGFDSRPADVPPSSSSMHKFLRQRSQGSPCDQNDNHYVKDEVSSPRKRPRKQHLYIDTVNEHHFPSQNQQDTDHTPKLDPAHNSMIANERLLGPLPLKEKKPCVTGELSETTDKQNKDGGIIYVSQLRRSQHPMIQLCRRPRNAAKNHFRRYADIKHTEEESVSPHEVCSQTSTWLRSSGWKLQHFNGHLQKIEQYESDMLDVMDRLKGQCELVLDSMTDDELETKHRTFLRETMMGNIERIKRSRLHTQETRESMMKILDVNGKVVDIMKKFATHLPTKLLTTSTSVTDDNET